MDVIILDPGSTITGECALTGYVGKIELLSYSHGVAQQITGDHGVGAQLGGFIYRVTRELVRNSTTSSPSATRFRAT